MSEIEIVDWGLIPYNEAFAKQKEIVEEIHKTGKGNYLIFCEHPSVITIGKNGTMDNILPSTKFLNSVGIQVAETDRGGDVTLHNPGQLVGYPIFNLTEFRQDLHWFLRTVEECIIELIAIYGIKGHRIEGMTGVWVVGQRKIAALGFHCSRWITSHGFALNVHNDLNEFSYIIPCGIKGKEVTSIKVETGTHIDINELKLKCGEIIKKKFLVLKRNKS